MEVQYESEKVQQGDNSSNSLTLLWGTWELWCDVATSNEQQTTTAETSSLGVESAFTHGQPKSQTFCDNTHTSNNNKINDIGNDNIFTKREISKNSSNSLNINQEREENWLDQVRSIGLFDSAEGFWGLHDCIVEPSQLPIGTSYYLFRKHVAPMWEHEANRRGGKWVITFTQPPPSSSSSSSSLSSFHSSNLDPFQAFALSRAKSLQNSCIRTNNNTCNNNNKNKDNSIICSNADKTTVNSEANHINEKGETNRMPVDVAWERLCLAVIGELLPCDEEEICGIVVSRNKPKATLANNSHFTSYNKNGLSSDNNSSNSGGEWKLSLWTRTADDKETQLLIAAFIAKLLSLDSLCEYDNVVDKGKDKIDSLKDSKDDDESAVDSKQKNISHYIKYNAQHSSKNLQSMLSSTLFTGNISYVVHRELMLAKQQTNKTNYVQPYVFKPRYTYAPPRESRKEKPELMEEIVPLQHHQ